MQANYMKYIDDKGVTHEIHLPTGTMKAACALIAAEDWAELAKFPKWGMLIVLVLLPSPMAVQS